MTLRTATIAAHAGRATTQFQTGLTWPPVQPLAIPDPSGTDPLGSYPLIDRVISVELISGIDPNASPENRVERFIESRTETLRSLANELVELMNLLPYYFLDRDGESNVTVSGTPAVTTPAPSYMRRNLDMGGQKITDLADGTDPQDLVSFLQYETVQFAGEDNVEQILQTEIIRRDGTVPMAKSLDMALFRVANLLNPPTAADQAEPKGHFDGQVVSFQTNYLNRTGNTAMTGNLSMQDLVTSPRYKIANVGLPTASGDLVNKFFLDQQFSIPNANDIPVGMVLPFFGNPATLPPTFIVCDGREVSRFTYQNLFLVIGTAYGAPSTSSVFKLPNLCGRTVIAPDNMGGISANRVLALQGSQLGGLLGSEKVALSTPNLAPHTHSYDDAYSADATVTGVLQGAGTVDADNTVVDVPLVTNAAGLGAGHNTVQPSMSVYWIVRV